MNDWLKRQKVSLLIGFVCVIVVATLFKTSFFQEEEIPFEEEWAIAGAEEQPDEMSTAVNLEEQAETEPVVMLADIKGAVSNPGVYEVFENDRILHLIEKAGGLTNEADTTAINFALKVSDEMVVYIPRKGEEVPYLGGDASIGSGPAENGKQQKVNLNSATASELETLPGIGPSKSAAIIEYRVSTGAFKAIEDLKLISGIGDKTFEKLKEFITVK
jgi:competence protein ComEA